jgi:hypothetical protein
VLAVQREIFIVDFQILEVVAISIGADFIVRGLYFFLREVLNLYPFWGEKAKNSRSEMLHDIDSTFSSQGRKNNNNASIKWLLNNKKDPIDPMYVVKAELNTDTVSFRLKEKAIVCLETPNGRALGIKSSWRVIAVDGKSIRNRKEFRRAHRKCFATSWRYTVYFDTSATSGGAASSKSMRSKKKQQSLSSIKSRIKVALDSQSPSVENSPRRPLPRRQRTLGEMRLTVGKYRPMKDTGIEKKQLSAGVNVLGKLDAKRMKATDRLLSEKRQKELENRAQRAMDSFRKRMKNLRAGAGDTVNRQEAKARTKSHSKATVMPTIAKNGK